MDSLGPERGQEPAITRYQVTPAAAAEGILRDLSQSTETRSEPIALETADYYDTFDWRLYRADYRLALLGESRPARLELHGPEGLRLAHEAEGTPGFAETLPGGRLRERLGPILEMRKLLPVARVERRVQRLAILDRERKTVARVALAEARATAPAGGAPQSLPAVIAVEPVRGYRRWYRRVVSMLAARPELGRWTGDELDAALSVLGRAPGDYRSKVRVALDPGARADDSMRLIHRALLDTMLVNEPGLREDIDSEFLHDFRVAVRRTRSALTQVKGVLPAAATSRFRREFAWLGEVTGPTRDLDVHLLTLPDYQATLPVEVRADLEPLERFLRRRQRLEQQRLVRALDSTRYRDLIAAWRAFLEAGDDPGEALRAATPILELASDRIWKAYRRVFRRGRAIGPETAAEALHRLRIDCKKLRYLMEFFHSLYPKATIGQLIKALKELQDNLGDFNDLEIQQQKLKRFAHDMAQEEQVPVETVMALGVLVERLRRRQVEERRRFHTCFDRFSAPARRRRFKTLFRTGSAV